MAEMTVEDSSLTAVADAIRTKGGTSDPLVFPDGFVSAIETISSEGGSIVPFVDRSITEVTAEMLEGCKSIGDYAFRLCKNLKSVVIPGGVSTVYNYAFGECTSLSNVVIMEGLKTFGGSVFSGCTSLTNITIPSSVKSIGGNTFKDCAALTTIELKGITPPSISYNVFLNSSNLSKIIVPVGSLEAYKSATNWSVFADIMVEATE